MEILHGDCAELCQSLPAKSVNLIMTSPPYANRRQGVYDGIDEADYPDWFATKAAEFHRVLAPNGSMVVNIKEHVTDNCRSLYVYKTIEALQQTGWMWRDDFIWVKTQMFPNHGRYRLKDGWEHCLHFSKNKVIKFFKHAVALRPTKKAEAAGAYEKTGNKSAYAMNRHTLENFEGALPPNYIMAITGNSATKKFHPATYPPELPEFFIKLLTETGDTVLDPFAGSGTTGTVAVALNRRAICMDSKPEYCDLMRNAKPWQPKKVATSPETSLFDED